MSSPIAGWIEAPPEHLAQTLEVALLLQRKPVGVKLFSDAGSFVAWPSLQPDESVFYCGAVHDASEGRSIKLALSDCGCDTAPRTLGMEDGFLERSFVESYVESGLYPALEVADSLLPTVPTLSGTAGVAVAPLSSYSSINQVDVVILALDPHGAMRVAQAARFLGWPLRAESMGMHGVCAECTAAPHSTGQVCTSLLCSGARHNADWSDTAMSVGVPASLLAQLVWAIVKTADRYETDQRKERVSITLRGLGATASPLAAQLGSLKLGGGYFHEPGVAYARAAQR